MPANTFLNRVNTVDFFAVLIPGVYLAANISLLGFWCVDRSATNETPWQIINGAIIRLELNGLLIFVLAAFLLGNTVRAVPIRVVDRLSTWINRCLCRLPLWENRQDDYREDFPYVNILNKIFELLYKHSYVSEGRPCASPEWGLRKLAEFNYWKALLCSKSSDSFAFVLAAESRVRLFAGIIWATGVSCVICALAMCFPQYRQWYGPFVASLIVSLLLFAIFVTSLRPMRHEEARAVYLAFLSLLNETASTAEPDERALDELMRRLEAGSSCVRCGKFAVHWHLKRRPALSTYNSGPPPRRPPSVSAP